MVKHIILWKLKSEFNTDEIKEGVKNSLESLLGTIPGLLEIKVETENLESSNADLMLYSVFESKAALKGYSVHPEHVKVADTFVRPYTESRACFDFEVK
ncbi:MAG: Dabb family protein [Oscillospiraceae bacterium]|nr:Dabb family protein [Oscillospiraceae bacterium]